MKNLEKSPTNSPQASQFATTRHVFLGNMSTFVPKVSIKLQGNNFLLWNQQVESVTPSHELHKIMANPQIPPMLISESDQIGNVVSKKYEA